MLQHSITHHVPSRCYSSGGGMAVGTRGAPPPFDVSRFDPARLLSMAGDDLDHEKSAPRR